MLDTLNRAVGSFVFQQQKIGDSGIKKLQNTYAQIFIRFIGQYKGKITEEELKKHIEERDKLQKESGYYKIYPITKVIDVTNLKTPEDTMNKLLEYINI